MGKHLSVLVALGVWSAASPAQAKGGAKDLDLFTTVGTKWAFDVTEQEPGGSTQTAYEEWHVAKTEPFGSAMKSYIVLSEIDRESGSSMERQVEYAVRGKQFFDISRLEKGRHALSVEEGELDSWIPLMDLSKLGKAATVVRYPDNPLAYVRYEVVGEFRLPSGTTYKGVVHATRNRGDTETTDDWWYSPSDGVLKIQLKMPEIAGGTTITWVRTQIASSGATEGSAAEGSAGEGESKKTPQKKKRDKR